ncbi:MAG: zinc ribbon domain-containing protein [Dehalococcoidia bacterium]|nr:zinc ribbon domain-containing protein [Dehalococcoidia bacterium]
MEIERSAVPDVPPLRPPPSGNESTPAISAQTLATRRHRRRSRSHIPAWRGRSTLIFAVVIAFGLALAVQALDVPAAMAESGPTFTEMVVTILPEYDQPRVLVVLRGELPADTPLPAQVRLRLPADATVTYACSLKQPNDDRTCQQPTSEPDGDYQAVTYDLTTPVMYVEYYYGTFTGAGQRSTDFSFWPPYPSKSLQLAIPAPSDATDFNVSPAATRTANEQGAKHYIYDFQDVPSDKPINVQLTYSRPTDEPWAPAQPQDAGATAVGPNDDGGVPSDAILFLALAAALTVALVGYNTVGRRIRFNMGLVEAPQREDADGGLRSAAPAYCSHCGVPVRQGAVFCFGCGRELRLTPRDEA